MCVAGLLAVSPASADAVSFSGPTNFGTGAGSRSVAMGEFNGDSQPDLAVVNDSSTSNNVSILLGAGEGSFTGPTNIAVGSNPQSVAVGEFDGDSNVDLAIANQDNVAILLGTGDGSFTGPTNFALAAGSGPVSVAVSEFNSDSNPDLAVANMNGNDVSIMLGDGEGSFSGPTDFAVGSIPVSVAVGEFNGDSQPDLAVANILSSNVSILLGAGDGSFTGPTNFAVGAGPRSVAVGEFNGDSNSDLAVANGTGNNVSIILGNGDGSFTGPANFAAGALPASVAVGEFNGDSDPDLAIGNQNSNNVSILLGAAEGSFDAPLNFGAGSNPMSVLAGDLNGDPHTDLAVANFSSNNVSILVGQAEPSIATQATGSATIGQPISDEAVLEGGDSPTGQITFRVYGPDDTSCADPPVFTSDPVTVSGNGTYNAPPPGFTPTSPGTYRWRAFYSGDPTNAAVSGPCNAASETSSVAKAGPNLATDSTDATLGGIIHNTAILTEGHNPTGQITFKAFGPGDSTCANTPAFTDTKTVTDNDDYISAGYTPTQAGTYRWTAEYSGDSNNDPASATCNAATNDASTVAKARPTLSTTASSGVPLGAKVHATAAIVSGHSPTGTITFRLYGPDDPDCVGVPVFGTEKSVTANGSYQSFDFSPARSGVYHWTASYSGDTGNEATTSVCTARESVEVSKVSPKFTAAASRNIALGRKVRDRAKLALGHNPTGIITFRLFGPGDRSCSRPPVFVTEKAVRGNGAFRSAKYTPTKSGGYRWSASYSGDSDNRLAAIACNVSDQSVRVRKRARHRPRLPRGPSSSAEKSRTSG